jgi:acyl dehydratase
MTLFDVSAVGLKTRPVSVEVEAASIRRYASAIGETASVCHDLDAANAAGYAGLLAPPTFGAVLVEAAGAQLVAQGGADILALFSPHTRLLIHGEETLRFVAPIVSGQVAVVTAQVISVNTLKGGRIQRACIEISVVDSEGAPLMSTSRTILHVSSK